MREQEYPNGETAKLHGGPEPPRTEPPRCTVFPALRHHGKNKRIAAFSAAPRVCCLLPQQDSVVIPHLRYANGIPRVCRRKRVLQFIISSETAVVDHHICLLLVRSASSAARHRPDAARRTFTAMVGSSLINYSVVSVAFCDRCLPATAPDSRG